MEFLLRTLLSECVKRDFKTLCGDGKMRYTGMCAILEDISKEGLISEQERKLTREFLAINRPDDANDTHWYESTEQGNLKRIEFLWKYINLTKKD